MSFKYDADQISQGLIRQSSDRQKLLVHLMLLEETTERIYHDEAVPEPVSTKNLMDAMLEFIRNPYPCQNPFVYRFEKMMDALPESIDIHLAEKLIKSSLKLASACLVFQNTPAYANAIIGDRLVDIFLALSETNRGNSIVPLSERIEFMAAFLVPATAD